MQKFVESHDYPRPEGTRHGMFISFCFRHVHCRKDNDRDSKNTNIAKTLKHKKL